MTSIDLKATRLNVKITKTLFPNDNFSKDRFYMYSHKIIVTLNAGMN